MCPTSSPTLKSCKAANSSCRKPRSHRLRGFPFYERIRSKTRGNNQERAIYQAESISLRVSRCSLASGFSSIRRDGSPRPAFYNLQCIELSCCARVQRERWNKLRILAGESPPYFQIRPSEFTLRPSNSPWVDVTSERSETRSPPRGARRRTLHFPEGLGVG